MLPKISVETDLYKILGLPFDSDVKKVKAAYRRAALVAHPDKGGTAEAFQDISIALQVLSCEATRESYNRDYMQHHVQTKKMHAPCHRFQTNHLPTRARTQLKKPKSYLFAKLPPKLKTKARPFPRASVLASHCAERAQQEVQNALAEMRKLLQSMEAEQRRASIQSLAPNVRAALLTVMQKSKEAGCQVAIEAPKVGGALGYRLLNRQSPSADGSGVRVIETAAGQKYRAHLVIKGLRFYTTTSTMQIATQHHQLLLKLRNAVAAQTQKSPGLLTQPKDLLAVFNSVLAAYGTSANNVGLHVFVYMRGTPWLDHNTYILSPVLQLEAAVVVYAKLVHAQISSWEALRAEWLKLLQAKGMPPSEAMLIADSARQRALMLRLKHAEVVARHAMNRHSIKAYKAQCIAKREKQRDLMTQKRLVVLEQRTLRQKWKLRQKISQGILFKNMTTEEMMQSTSDMDACA